MGIVQTLNLVYDYITRDEYDNEIKIRAIDGLDIDVEKGQFIVVLGRNGSGKSSFAKHLNALLRPTSGTVVINGLDTSDKKNKWSIRQEAGMVFQNPDNQLVSQIVEDDVAFGAENLAVPTDEIRYRVNKALLSVNMTDYRMRAVNNLSGGQKQRVAIAGIMAMEPECIILDEPTAMLDPVGRREVIESLRKLNLEKGITVILITHHMDEAINADNIFVMDKGKILISGKPSKIFANVELLKEAGLEVPVVTELAYELKKEGIELPEGLIDEDELIEEVVKLYKR
jgi:energy-coupling factor transporter ATPase